MNPSTDILETPMQIENNITDELAGCVSRATVIRRNEPLAKHTTLRVGGPADVYVEPATEKDLAQVPKRLQEQTKSSLENENSLGHLRRLTDVQSWSA